jgi:hypothetical protein
MPYPGSIQLSQEGLSQAVIPHREPGQDQRQETLLIDQGARVVSRAVEGSPAMGVDL